MSRLLYYVIALVLTIYVVCYFAGGAADQIIKTFPNTDLAHWLKSAMGK